MKDTTITHLGTFARRQLASLLAIAQAGAEREALKLRKDADLALNDLAKGIVPSGEVSAARLNGWLSQLAALRDMESILHADERPMDIASAGALHAGEKREEPHKIKVRFTGLGRTKTLTYQTAQDVALGQEVEVPRWPDMKPGPPLRGTVVALDSDYEGLAVTIIGG